VKHHVVVVVVVAAAGDDDSPRLRASTFSQVVVARLGGVAQFDCEYDNTRLTEWYRDQRRLMTDSRSVSLCWPLRTTRH